MPCRGPRLSYQLSRSLRGLVHCLDEPVGGPRACGTTSTRSMPPPMLGGYGPATTFVKNGAVPAGTTRVVSRRDPPGSRRRGENEAARPTGTETTGSLLSEYCRLSYHEAGTSNGVAAARERFEYTDGLPTVFGTHSCQTQVPRLTSTAATRQPRTRKVSNAGGRGHDLVG